MSRIRVHAEDVITVAAALALFLSLAAKSIGHMRLSEQNYWDFAFILMPVAALVLAASIRYAFRPVGAPAIREVTAETGSISGAAGRVSGPLPPSLPARQDLRRRSRAHGREADPSAPNGPE